ncbi:MAG: hypothetical protein IPH03_12020 [Tetrasphaera sp.]|nr:hypothetical protein [Tetrasphaera sp.]
MGRDRPLAAADDRHQLTFLADPQHCAGLQGGRLGSRRTSVPSGSASFFWAYAVAGPLSALAATMTADCT